MPYTIDYSDSGKSPIVVNDGTVDTSTSLSLIGKNYTNSIFDIYEDRRLTMGIYWGGCGGGGDILGSVPEQGSKV